MEEKMNEEMARSEPKESKELKERKELSEEQKQRQKKLIVYPLMGILFACSMWLIFAPSKDAREKEKQQQGFNTTMPIANNEVIIEDKRTAYEKMQLQNKADMRNKQMRDLSLLFGSGEKTDDVELNLTPSDNMEKELAKPKTNAGNNGKSKNVRTTTSNIKASASAYKDINRTLGNFYEKPKEDVENQNLRKELEELKQQMNSNVSEKNATDEQIALLEKSYELAAKYMPNNSGDVSTKKDDVANDKPKPLEKNGKAMAQAVAKVRKQVVSSLHRPMSNEELIAQMSEDRNFGFNTAVGEKEFSEVNTIKACIHEDKTLSDGQSIRLRLLDQMRVGRYILPKQSIITAMAKITGERLQLAISSIEHQGLIIPVELQVYDTDGQKGIFIPGSMELNAAKEIAANMGSSLGSSINISTDVKAQLASDLGKGLLQGTSQYISKKMRVVKVTLKSGYNVMLYQEEN